MDHEMASAVHGQRRTHRRRIFCFLLNYPSGSIAQELPRACTPKTAAA